eukprot:CAMPEP_0202819006 /NCGR_PEP_ID=MMETSP1389-20130828/8778_1 /ASSEMBLY_ACC=CAM_ASM_000865 /TAXON_ID=302021 /ORGANISM="Rhodomonas sp., Strain CCMP768" /LENGTH=156 /DNA_ID=CAMNT_0049491483 /DNA_START=97 /DNA_END=564 /DNA_ORIENTATION=-
MNSYLRDLGSISDFASRCHLVDRSCFHKHRPSSSASPGLGEEVHGAVRGKHLLCAGAPNHPLQRQLVLPRVKHLHGGSGLDARGSHEHVDELRVKAPQLREGVKDYVVDAAEAKAEVEVETLRHHQQLRAPVEESLPPPRNRRHIGVFGADGEGGV